MIRHLVQWRYVLPRLAIALVLFVGTWLAIEPLLHSFLTRFGERIVRAKIDIDDVNVKLANADLTITGVQIANPRSLDRNLVEFDQATLDIATTSVLQRRLHVREARMSGVRFNTPRSKSGKVNLPPLSADVPEELESKLKSMGSGALRQFARIMAQDFTEELLSIQLSRELAARWPEEYKQLEERAMKFAKRIEEIEAELKAPTNFANMATSFPDRVKEVDALKQELLSIGHRLDDIREQAQRDREAIAIARRHDQEVLRRKLTLKDIDPQQLSEYLLDDELAGEATELLRWIRLARRYWPGDVEMADDDRQSGEDILFPGLKPLPRALVDKLRLEGTLDRNGTAVAWRGEMFNLTTDPAFVDQPLRIRAQLQGEMPVIVDATLDRRTSVARDRVVVSLPAIRQPARTLGRSDQLAVGIAPGELKLWAELNLEDEKLSGRMLVQQTQLQINTQLAPQLGPRLAKRLQEATKHVDTLQAEVKLAGTLDKPTWELKSNLGPQLAESMTVALRAELESRRVELSNSLEQYLAAEDKKLDGLLAEAEGRVSNRVTHGALEIENLRRQVAGRIRLPSLGKLEDLPVANPFTVLKPGESRPR
jgi:uncharacterized protein (TIGR03545 family)